MEMIRVSSSAILAVGYDLTSGRMTIHFVQGNTYDFCRVPEQVYNGLMSATSKGIYYNTFMRDQYPC